MASESGYIVYNLYPTNKCKNEIDSMGFIIDSRELSSLMIYSIYIGKNLHPLNERFMLLETAELQKIKIVGKTNSLQIYFFL